MVDTFKNGLLNVFDEQIHRNIHKLLLSTIEKVKYKYKIDSVVITNIKRI